ncbi:MAG: nuclear transport factor 2 family protein [Nostoc sp.]|uniref:nuclear transport factor 2 family protein n=1 Tax=Nostoc sp. TaxID=1180 RepID=UPI002FF68FB4
MPWLTSVPAVERWVLSSRFLTGGERIVHFLNTNVGTQTTTHVITNARVHVEEDVATLQALVDATHLPLSDHFRQCQMMNWYEVELIRQGRLWRIRRLIIDNAWFIGDPQVLLGK